MPFSLKLVKITAMPSPEKQTGPNSSIGLKTKRSGKLFFTGYCKDLLSALPNVLFEEVFIIIKSCEVEMKLNFCTLTKYSFPLCTPKGLFVLELFCFLGNA